MATVLASKLIDRVSNDLHDLSNERWGRDTLLEHLNDGQVEVCNIKPDAYTITTAFQLAAGSKQSVPANCIQLQSIIRNMGTDGNTPGASIPLVSMQQLDLVRPTWHSETAAAAVKHWLFNEKNPKVFWVYPKNTGTGWVEAILGAIPPEVAAEGNVITLDDIYQNALRNFMLYRAYSLDADFAANAELARLYYANFMNSLLVKEQREKAEMPKPGGKDNA
jgi:hypothetical protein